jgi:deoxyribodipyrimidine photo-lyase
MPDSAVSKTHLVWFRQDLRLIDNTALARACEDPNARVLALFVATPQQWQLHDMAPIRQRFILRNVDHLARSLQAINIPLLYLEIEDYIGVPELIQRLVEQHGIDAIYANREYGWNEKQRDKALSERLAPLNCEFHQFHDQSMLPPGLATQTGKPYTVYTPFKKRWLETWRASRPHTLPAPTIRKQTANATGDAIPVPAEEPVDKHWPAGEGAAWRRLESFCDERIEDYKRDRDMPRLNGTSAISPWLAAGVLSARSCLEVASNANRGRLSGGQEGIDCWISELIWRDFYIHILDSFPVVSKNRAFKRETETIAWRDSKDDFAAWCSGRTGIPIVDAAMRQLLQTGWMHNRLRMVVAMFLSKQLLLDWRLGERFFMQHLIDGHLASNNGGWQWAASTGTDAVPYFRIFNPVTQSQRFDANGVFIRQYVPELAAVEGKDIHLPLPMIRQAQAPDYPAPIVDLKYGRQRALDAFAAAKKSG